LRVTPRARAIATACATAVAGAAALVQVWQVARVIAARVPYPIALEWMEEGEMYEAYRLLHGMPIYGPPSAHFLPYPYPPLHVAVITALGWIFGLDYVMGRLVSIAGLVAIAAMAAFVSAQNAPSRRDAVASALLAIGSIAAGYPVTDALADTVRLDTMAMALSFGAALALAPERAASPSWKRIATVAFLLTASVYAKQTAIFFAAWIVLFAIVRDRRAGLRLLVSTLALSAIVLALLQRMTDGWFWFWLMHTKEHVMRTSNLARGVAREAWHAPFLGLVPLVVVLVARARRLGARERFWCGMLMMAVVASFLPLLKDGGWVNNLVPLVAVAWPAAIVLARALPANARSLNAAIVMTGALVLLLQRWNPDTHTPTRAQRDEAEAFAAVVHDLRGGVELPIFPFFAVRNSEPAPQIALVAYFDARAARMQVSPGEAVDASGARWLIVTDYSGEDWLLSTAHAYRFVRDLDVHGEAFQPKSAGRTSLWERVE
jgi:hypothetical protein